MSIATDLIHDLEAETALTRKVLEAVPEDRLAWKPHERSMSLGTLASHLAETPAWLSSMLEADMDFAAMQDYRPFAARSRTELLAELGKNAGAAVAALRERDDALLESPWTMRNGATVLMQAPRHRAIREIGIHHWIHHRGQLTVYLRLLDVPVPATYGPTADHPSFG
jgi:uncharacterized damage-inducible protein DinB